jgi:hypothetical protein
MMAIHTQTYSGPVALMFHSTAAKAAMAAVVSTRLRTYATRQAVENDERQQEAGDCSRYPEQTATLKHGLFHPLQITLDCENGNGTAA